MKVILKKLFFIVLFFGCILGTFGCILGAHGLNNFWGVDNESISESDPKLSVVMPVYNVSKYLDEALTSVENQTFRDLEIICVNDGSTDNSLDILEDHAKRDSRIRIINQENQGVSEARNNGMRAAIGEYVYFFDSDDVLAPYIMEKAVNLLDEHGADAYEFKFLRCRYDDVADLSDYAYNDSLIEIHECEPGANPFAAFEGTIKVWARVYKKSFLDEHNILFNKNIKISEDTLFSLEGRAYMKKLIKDGNIGYCYRVSRPGSAVTANPEDTRVHVENNLMVINEMIALRERLNFNSENVDSYLLSYMLGLVNGRWVNIKNLKSLSDRQQLASIAYETLQKNFVKKYNIALNESNKKKLDDLKNWAKYSDTKLKTNSTKKVDKKTTQVKKGSNSGKVKQPKKNADTKSKNQSPKKCVKKH